MKNLMLLTMAMQFCGGIGNAAQLERIRAAETLDVTQAADMRVPEPGRGERAKLELGVVQALKSLSLLASDGTGLMMEYILRSADGETIADPFRVTASLPRPKGTEKIRVVIMTYYDSSNMPANTLLETQNIDLEFDGQVFRGVGRGVKLSESHIGYGYNYRHEIAVVVDGVWLTDPVSDSHNFRFKLGWR